MRDLNSNANWEFFSFNLANSTEPDPFATPYANWAFKVPISKYQAASAAVSLPLSPLMSLVEQGDLKLEI